MSVFCPVLPVASVFLLFLGFCCSIGHAKGVDTAMGSAFSTFLRVVCLFKFGFPVGPRALDNWGIFPLPLLPGESVGGEKGLGCQINEPVVVD